MAGSPESGGPSSRTRSKEGERLLYSTPKSLGRGWGRGAKLSDESHQEFVPGQIAMDDVDFSPFSPGLEKHRLLGKMMGHSGKELAQFIMEREKEEREWELARQREREELDMARLREEREFLLREKQVELENARANPDNSQSPERNRGSDFAPVRIKMPQYDEREDIEVFLASFERLARIQQWQEDTWGVRLGTLLCGKAREVYTHMSDSDAADYKKLKHALLLRFKLSAEAYRRRFRTARKQKDESFPQYVVQMEMAFEHWLELSGRKREVEEVIDMLLLEQFLEGMTPELATFIRERAPATVQAAAELAEHFTEARWAVASYSKGQSRRNTGGDAGSGPTHAGGNKGNPPPGKPVALSNTERLERQQKRQCFTCGREGHGFRSCPKKPGSHSATLVTSDCVLTEDGSTPMLESPSNYNPRFQVRVGSVEVVALRDTGADTVVVSSDLVSAEQYTGRKKNVSMASRGFSQICPVALVDLDTPFFTGKVEAVVMDDLVAPVLIGNEARLENGDTVSVPVYPVRQIVSAVQTRGQARKEGQEPVQLHAGKPLIGKVTPTELAQMQKDDPSLEKFRHLATVRAAARNGVHFEWKRGLLYRVYAHAGECFRQVVVPKELREEVIRLAHDTPMAGHLGSGKTRDRVWREFYWPGISSEIRRYCLSCDVCQRTIPKGKVRKVPLGKVPIIDEPFRRVAVDLVGPISPPSERGHRYMLVLVDYATRYPEAAPLKNIDSETVAEALWNMWSRLGIPDEVYSDCGTQFISDVMGQVHQLLSVKGITTTPYHAQANGLVERFNGTLKKMLQKLCLEQPRQWDRYINALLFAYREVPQESLKFSPFELLFGRTVRGPLQVLRQVWTNEATDAETRTTAEYVVDLRNRIEETCALARENLSQAADCYEKAFNRKTVSRSFKPGSQVLLLLPVKHNKLELSWKGPFTVVEKVGFADYKIQMGIKTKIYHANLLKQYHVRDVDEAVTVSVVVEDGDEVAPVGVCSDSIPLIPLTAEEGPAAVQIGEALSDEARGVEVIQGKDNVGADYLSRSSVE